MLKVLLEGVSVQHCMQAACVLTTSLSVLVQPLSVQVPGADLAVGHGQKVYMLSSAGCVSARALFVFVCLKMLMVCSFCVHHTVHMLIGSHVRAWC